MICGDNFCITMNNMAVLLTLMTFLKSSRILKFGGPVPNVILGSDGENVNTNELDIYN